jgi:hypothetical protein
VKYKCNGRKSFEKELQTLNFKLQTTLDVSFLAKGICKGGRWGELRIGNCGG